MDKIYVRVYSAKKYDETGNGNAIVDFNGKGMSVREKRIRTLAIKEEWKNKNIDYRSQNVKKKGRPVRKNLGDLENTKIPRVCEIKNVNFIKLDANTGNTIYIMGSSKMGKSTILMNIYKNYFEGKKFVSTLFSLNCHIPLYSARNLIKICKFDKDCVDYVKIQKRANFLFKNKFNFLEIFDDITDVRYKQLVNDLILTYRNSNISTIMSLQYPNLLAKSSRGSINNLLFFGFNTDECIKVVLDAFLKSYFLKMGVRGETNQIALYRDLTKNHQFIYLHPASGFLQLCRLKL